LVSNFAREANPSAKDSQTLLYQFAVARQTRARRSRPRARFCGYNPGVPEDVRVLRLGEMIRRPKGRLARRLVHALVSVALRLFFRRIETTDASVVPASGPLVFVLNHPNGLIDPALVFTALPRPVSFLAKSTLFRLPVAGWLMRTVEALPLYRRIDEGEDPARNRLTFEACRALLARGRCIAVFPEGVSHDEPRMLPVKTGAARIALGAVAIDDANEGDSDEGDGDATPPRLDLRIVPVGLYYTSKTSFRSEALLRFGEPFGVPVVRLDEEGDPPRDAVRELSARIEAALRGVTLNVESRDELEVAKRAEQLFSSLYEGIAVEASLAARFEFLRRFAGARGAGGGRDARGAGRLRARLESFDAELRLLGISPDNLTLTAHSAWFVFRHFLLRGALLIALSPLALAGALLHLPAYAGATFVSRLFPRHGPDDAGATVKVLASILLVPLTWLVVTAAALLCCGWRAAVVAFPAVILCGYAAMRTLEELYDMRGWFKAAILLVRRRGLFLRLLLERRALLREMGEFSD
jgi:1-acyl-sn-glycerol-3-phosphate acyltransferase